MERRLAAILATDMVGYSRLTRADEEGTLSRQKTHRKNIVDPKICEHHGRIVKATGDGLLVEFPSVVDAVRCPVGIQLAVADWEAGSSEDRRIAYRIGINLGDIIIDQDDIYGDGVNIAARLETLAEPGGICVSRTVVNHVKGKVNSGFEDLGDKQAKNIAEPIRVFRVKMAPEAAGSELFSKPRGITPWAGYMYAAVALAVLSLGGILWWQPWTPDIEPASLERMAFPLPEKPSIAVLPFADFSDEQAHEHFADGLTEDIITNLSRLPHLFVIARNSSFTYKDKAVKVQQVAEELGVQYLLEGSVRRASDQVRVTVQLVDAISGHHIWAQQYNRTLDDVFAVQDELTQQIAATLVGYRGILTDAQLRTARRKPPESLRAYDFYLLGSDHKHRFTQEAVAKAREYYQKAIALDPEFARAYLGLAWTHQHDIWLGWSDDRERSLASFKHNAQKAVELDDLDGEAHLALGQAYFIEGDVSRGEAEFEKALAVGSNDADVLAILGWNLPGTLGRSEQAVQVVERAMRLNPHYPDWYRHALGYAQYHAEQFEKAAEVLQAVEDPTLETTLYLAVSNAQLGRYTEATAAANEVLRMDPDFSANQYMRNVGYKDPTAISELLEGVRLAGLPE